MCVKGTRDVGAQGLQARNTDFFHGDLLAISRRADSPCRGQSGIFVVSGNVEADKECPYFLNILFLQHTKKPMFYDMHTNKKTAIDLYFHNLLFFTRQIKIIFIFYHQSFFISHFIYKNILCILYT